MKLEVSLLLHDLPTWS